MELPAVIRRYQRKRQKKRKQIHREAFKSHLQLLMAPSDPNTIDVAFCVKGETEFQQPPANRLPAPFYWLSRNGVRHNQWCGWYNACKGRMIRYPDGKPCRLCGG